MFEAFGPFAVMVEPNYVDRTLPYVRLLGLGRGADEVLRSVRVAASEPDAERRVVVLLRDQNWRAQIIDAVAAYVRPSDACVAQMWQALDSGSWVSPQLAAVVSLLDSAFVAHATDRLRNHCEVIIDSDYVIEDPVERHSAQGPGSGRARSAKVAAALFALLEQDVPTDGRVAALRRDSQLQTLIAADVDDAAELARGWRDRLVQALAS